MKNIKIQPDVNWHALKPSYQHDDSIKIVNTNIKSKDGVELNVCDAFSNIIDTSTNNQTQLMLIDNVKMNDAFKLDIKIERYPEQFTTYLLGLGFPAYTGHTSYLKIIEETSDKNTRDYVIGTKIINDIGYNSTYFEVDVESDNGLYYNITLHAMI